MDEKKNIDRLFQEKFKDYEVFPDASAWKNIEKQLMKKKKRRIIPLWLRFAGAAAILLLLISTGFWFFDQRDNTTEQPNETIITDTDSKKEIKEVAPLVKEKNAITFEDTETGGEEEIISKTISKNNSQNLKNNVVNNPTIEKVQAKVTPEENIALSGVEKEKEDNDRMPLIEKPTKIDVIKEVDIIREKINTEKTAIAQEKIVNEPTTTKTDIQAEIEKTTTVVSAEITNKWSVGPSMAPVYYNTLGNGSPIDPALANNKKNSDGSVSYGLKVNYKLSDKFSLQSGINTLELGFTTQNVATLVSSSLLDGSNTNINTNVDGASVTALSTVAQNSETLNQRSSFDASGSLDQSLSYVEVPLEAKYNILQKKLGVNIIGGFSTYFLYQNKVSVTSFGKTSTLGEASNINSLNFSGNLGVDFDYDISKKLYINISPMFKYQFNTFSKNSGGFKPYYLGVYTGLNFRF